MQYFSGYSSFSDEEPLHHCLIVELRKRLGLEQINAINDKIYQLSVTKNVKPKDEPPEDPPSVDNDLKDAPEAKTNTHAGKLLVDATACPQDIAYLFDRFTQLMSARLKEKNHA